MQQKPVFDRKPIGDDGLGLREGYLTVTLPTTMPSVALGDIMHHTRAVPSREDREEVQDVGPRLQSHQEQFNESAHPDYQPGTDPLSEKERSEDPQYEAQYCDPTRGGDEKVTEEP